MMSEPHGPQETNVSRSKLRAVISASAAGTLIEWYDFFLFGSLAVFFSKLFFPPGEPTLALLGSLGSFATGFLIRPVGALFFGRMGDLFGRKRTFLVTLVLMGLSTTLIGFLPTFESVGYTAPLLMLLLRLLQGLALGGEYGGAAVYTAEFSPNGKRGFYTSFIQTTAALGFLVSLLVTLIVRSCMTDADFSSWGWRIPFILSAVLVGLSAIIRLRMSESPVFLEMHRTGRKSKAPITDTFKSPANRRRMLVALFGAVAGQASIWYTGHFYSLFFLQSTLHVDISRSYLAVAIALVAATPLYLFFGALSDRIGRRAVFILGSIATIVLLLPSFMLLATHIDQLSVVGIAALLWVILIPGIMFYAPLAAYLVELFPPPVRYTSLSIPYQIGNGIFGGLMPLIGFSLVQATGNIFAGLAYPLLMAVVTIGVHLFSAAENEAVAEAAPAV